MDTAPPTPSRPTLGAPTTPARTDRRWVGDAACDGADLALFDPVNRHVAARATALCATCPVLRECLLEALEDEDGTAYGPWLVRGGMTPKERRDLVGAARSTLVHDLRDALAPVPALAR